MKKLPIKIAFLIFCGGIALSTETVKLVSVDYYYVRDTPASERQFSITDWKYDKTFLTEAHVIGDACYSEFQENGRRTIRERIDCAEYQRVTSIPNYPVPKMNGKKWIGYKTLLFDTSSGDLDEGYYAIAGTKKVTLGE